jgi:thioredoxin reductase
MKYFGIKKENDIFTVITQGQKQYQAKTVILALGTERRKFNIPGEKEFFGKDSQRLAEIIVKYFPEIN